MDSLQPLKPGDPIPASMLNKVIEGAKIAFESQRSGAGDFTKTHLSNTTVQAVVSSDGPLPIYSVVSIEEPMYHPATHRDAFLSEPAIRVGRPNANTTRFAILQESVTTVNQIVPACVSGMSIVQLNVVSPSHEYANPNESCTMTTAASGIAQIVWRQSLPGPDGNIWALVSFPVGGGGSDVIWNDDVSTNVQYAIVMETISRPSNTTIRPPSGMGKIALLSKVYEQGASYENCTCYELANTEKLLKGLQILVQGPIFYPNPELAENEDSESRYLHYYIAIKTLGEYTAILNSDLMNTSVNTPGYSDDIASTDPMGTQMIIGRSTITVATEEDSADFEVVCLKLPPNTHKLPLGTGVVVNRTLSGSNTILEVMLGPCPKLLQVEQQEEEL